MKRAIGFLLPFLVILLMACQNPASDPGIVKIPRVKSCKAFDGSDNIIYTINYYYSGNTNSMVRSDYFDSTNTITSYSQYSYDSFGNAVKVINYNLSDIETGHIDSTFFEQKPVEMSSFTKSTGVDVLTQHSVYTYNYSSDVLVKSTEKSDYYLAPYTLHSDITSDYLYQDGLLSIVNISQIDSTSTTQPGYPKPISKKNQYFYNSDKNAVKTVMENLTDNVKYTMIFSFE